MGFGLHSVYNVVYQYQQGCRESNQKIDTELVSHHAALGACRGNGGIGNKRKIVTKESPSNDDCRHKRHADVGLGGNACSYRSKGDNGAYRGADRERDKARGEKYAGKQQVFRKEPEGKIDGSINGSHGFCRLGKGSGKDKYPNHQHDVGISGSRRVLQDAVVQRKPFGCGDGINRSYQERHGYGNFVKVVDDDGGYQVQAQKNDERHQCPSVRLVYNGSQFVIIHELQNL